MYLVGNVSNLDHLRHVFNIAACASRVEAQFFLPLPEKQLGSPFPLSFLFNYALELIHYFLFWRPP